MYVLYPTDHIDAKNIFLLVLILIAIGIGSAKTTCRCGDIFIGGVPLSGPL
jgi:hypothetical protein